MPFRQRDLKIISEIFFKNPPDSGRGAKTFGITPPGNKLRAETFGFMFDFEDKKKDTQLAVTPPIEMEEEEINLDRLLLGSGSHRKSKGISVLLVDDDQMVRGVHRMLVEQVLREKEAQVIQVEDVESGEKGIEKYLQIRMAGPEHGSEQVVVLSDINMQGMSGYEFVMKIRDYEKKAKKEEAYFVGITGFVN